MLPAVIIMRLLKFWGADVYLNYFFSFLMAPLGLPEWTSLVWVTAILSNLYAALAVLAQLGADKSLTIGQMSILGTIILIAHSLPVEARITQAMRVRFFSIVLTRLLVAMALGMCLHFAYRFFPVMQKEVFFFWMQYRDETAASLWSLLLFDMRSLIILSFLVCILILAVEVMKQLRIIAFFEYLMQPFLRLLGISNQLAHITALGTLLGLTYSSGYIIAQTKRHSYPAEDLAGTVIFLSLCHAIIEDTLLLLVLGADLSAILFARLFVSLLFVSILMRVMKRNALVRSLFIAPARH